MLEKGFLRVYNRLSMFNNNNNNNNNKQRKIEIIYLEINNLK